MPYIPDHSSSLYPPCFYCKHLTHMGGQGPFYEGWTCKALPRGILYGILTRQTDHTEELMSQEGTYVFESEEFDFDGEEGKFTITFEGDWKRCE